MAKKKSESSPPGEAPEAGLLPEGYESFLSELKERIRTAQLRASVAVNRELIALYWQIGSGIIERQKTHGWGKSVVERLARDLQLEFPGMSGFSPRNVWRMRAFYLAYTEDVRKLQRPVAEMDGEILPQPVAEIPWGHNAVLLDKIQDPLARFWYARQSRRERLEPQRPDPLDRERPLRAPRKGPNQFRKNPSRASVRPSPRDAQGPLQVRVPDARR